MTAIEPTRPAAETQVMAAAPPPKRGSILAAAFLLGVALAGSAAAVAYPRLYPEQPVTEPAQSPTTPPIRVAAAVATRVTPDAARTLPGNCLPLAEAAIFPRTTGYLKRWAVDIGTRVKAGQLLAEIETPEVDAQLAQAKATLAQDQANLIRAQAQEKYALAQEKRQKTLLANAAVSRDEYDSAAAAAGVATATVTAAEATIKVDEANIARMETLQAFQKITAPFDGVITARNFDRGALVQADNPTTTRELFHLMRTDVIRVWVYVPQTFATAVKCGQATTVYRQDDPTRTFAGTVARTADALDPATRTLLTEVHVPNPDNALRAGMYAQVKFTLDRTVFPALIPSAAVVVRTQAPTVGVLDANHAVHYRPVRLGRDWGTTIEVTAGLQPGETVVVRPGDDLPDGTVVEPILPPAN